MIDGDVRRQARDRGRECLRRPEAALTSALSDSGIAPARHLIVQRVDQVLEDTAGRQPGRQCP